MRGALCVVDGLGFLARFERELGGAGEAGVLDVGAPAELGGGRRLAGTGSGGRRGRLRRGRAADLVGLRQHRSGGSEQKYKRQLRLPQGRWRHQGITQVELIQLDQLILRLLDAPAEFCVRR